MHFHLNPDLWKFYDRDLMIYSEKSHGTLMQAPPELKDSFCLGEILGANHCCSVCQGILQIIDQNYFVDSLTTRINKEGFEFESFKFNVHSPLSSTFRYWESN